ncbi:hypothetical protein [Micromonospora sp. CB01531]|uniref:hypothetical protein n=1 Tax=Micromonospora sp. CB01531 TaxID=1718947 RepID=UPI00116112B1|nr:hypothetical protein [Micromonospora sp. CB01531]
MHEGRADVVVDASDLVGVVVPVLQLERAITVGSGPTLPPGVGISGGRDGSDADERSSAWSGGGYLGHQALAEAQRVP